MIRKNFPLPSGVFATVHKIKTNKQTSDTFQNARVSHRFKLYENNVATGQVCTQEYLWVEQKFDRASVFVTDVTRDF